MDDGSQEQAPKEIAVEEEAKWNKIVASTREGVGDGQNLIRSFAMLGTTVSALTEEFQAGDTKVDPATLDGLWKIFLETRRNVVTAYDKKKLNPEAFKDSITKAGMKTIDGLFHATATMDTDSSAFNRLAPELVETQLSLEEEYGISTHTPNVNSVPDLNRDFISGGNGEKITRVLQPGYIEQASGKVIRDAIVETA